MKRFVLAVALSLLAGPAMAQSYSTNAPVGQTLGGIQGQVFLQNTQPSGFSENALSSITATGTTQTTAALVLSRTVLITSCPTNAGVQLPSITRYTAITVLNRSGASCLVYPSPGATVETALGTDGATNAANTQATNTDVTYKPVSATRWLQ
jgi:hypothetical protein